MRRASLTDSPSATGCPISQIAHLAEDVVPFVALAGWFAPRGFAAPEILAADLDQGFLLIENLGAAGILDDEGRPDPDASPGDRIACALHAKETPGSLRVNDPWEPYCAPAYDPRGDAESSAGASDRSLSYTALGRPAAAPVSDERSGLPYLELWRQLLWRDYIRMPETSRVLRELSRSPNLKIWRGPEVGVRPGLGINRLPRSTTGRSPAGL